jgi:acetamidase/formamidase
MPFRRLIPLALVPALLVAQPTRALDRLAGEWTFTMTGDATPQRVLLVVDGDSLRGRIYGQRFAATLERDQLRFTVGSYRWRGTVAGDTLRGWLGVGSDSSRWSGLRFAPRAPRSFTYTPTRWSRRFGGDTVPALRLVPGDTVRTTSLDAGGWSTGAFGAAGNRPSPGGNPLTGPFVIEGTLPGDALVVRLLDVRTNRDWAFSGNTLMDRAMTTDYAAVRKFDGIDDKWRLDSAAGTARLAKPGAPLAGYTVPLRPFLGAIGVAPRDGAQPSTRESGEYGGNMEYARLRTGATLYLPVFRPGAHLLLGDGHAAQGDGEVTGDALETSMAITFVVDRLRYPGFYAPRAEDDDDLMAIGIAGSLDDALRRATSDLAAWLAARHGLSSSETALVLGSALAYDIPDIVGDQVSVVARVPKRLLTTLPRK